MTCNGSTGKKARNNATPATVGGMPSTSLGHQATVAPPCLQNAFTPEERLALRLYQIHAIQNMYTQEVMEAVATVMASVNLGSQQVIGLGKDEEQEFTPEQRLALKRATAMAIKYMRIHAHSMVIASVNLGARQLMDLGADAEQVFTPEQRLVLKRATTKAAKNMHAKANREVIASICLGIHQVMCLGKDEE